jgi:hypothetical protein
MKQLARTRVDTDQEPRTDRLAVHTHISVTMITGGVVMCLFLTMSDLAAEHLSPTKSDHTAATTSCQPL